MRPLRSQQKTRRRRLKTKKKRLVISLLILFIVINFIYLMNRDYFFIHQFEYQGTEVLDDADLQFIIDDYLAENKLFVFPRKNTLFLDTREIEDRLSFAFPRINTIEVRILEDDVLHVSLDERKAHSLWCDYQHAFIEDSLQESCYYADQTAYVYDRSPYFSNKVFPKIYLSDDRLGPQYQVLSKDSFHAFFDFMFQLEHRFDIKVDHVVIDEFGDVYVSIWRYRDHLYSSLFPKIIYNQRDSYEDILTNIDLSMSHADFKKDIKNKEDKLAYIDVRFPGRIFYKIQQ